MNKRILFLATVGILAANCIFGQPTLKTDTFSFVSEGKRLNGIIDLPVGQEATSIILIIQGSGRSNVIAGNWFDDLRSHFVQLGIACCVWDKPGCGKSEGEFDINQSVQSSADEAIAAIKELKHRYIQGCNSIGLWGISRAGWICPLVIEKFPSIAFWISVSGTDDKENFPYLLESNFKIEGRSEPDIKLLVSEWQQGTEIFRKGGSPEEYLKATSHLQQDTFCKSFLGYSSFNREEFTQNQKKFIAENHEFDKTTGLMIYVPNFENILSKIQCPVLAIFGEKDANVDWRKTKNLYLRTIGKNNNSKLSIKSFPDCNHSIQKSKTGGLRENNENNSKYQPCDGYFDTMTAWLKDNVKKSK
jgi:pimeloyl-ACP methyl ester carboxylesterase